MKRAFTYALSLALFLSLTACNKPQAEQPDSSQPDPASQAGVSVPEQDSIPASEPPVTQAAEQLSDAVPPAPAENEVPQDQAEPAAQEPVSEPVPEPVQPETPPAAAENPPAAKPAEQAQEQQSPAEQPQQQQSGEKNALEEALERGRQLAEERRKEFEEQRQQSSEIGVSLEEILAANPGAYVDENGSLHLPHLNEYEHIKLQ